MNAFARLRRGAGLTATLGVMLLAAGSLTPGAAGAQDSPTPDLAEELRTLGRQAQDLGHAEQAAEFLRRADRLALQDPDPSLDPPVDVPPSDDVAPDGGEPPARATLEGLANYEVVQLQQLTADVNGRLQRARELVRDNQPEAALSVLRLAREVAQANPDVPAESKAPLLNRIQNQYFATVRDKERIDQERIQQEQLNRNAESKLRALDELDNITSRVDSLMEQFGAALRLGQFNILAFTTDDTVSPEQIQKPFVDARDLAIRARALSPTALAPRLAGDKAIAEGFLAQSLAYREAKFYRFMLTLQDVERASIPFNDSQPIQYPAADAFIRMSERRTKRYESVDLFEEDAGTRRIREKLDQQIEIPFSEPTSLKDVMEYFETATADPGQEGIQIYLNKAGLEEAGFTEDDEVQLDLKGVKLKTALKLILDEFNLSYTVADGVLRVDSKDSEDQPTTIRVYPVADLSCLPMTLFGGGGGGGGLGGGGGMGGGMGGMGGGGMGGMGGGMGGMGGGMGGGGMGGGGMGGMFSVGTGFQEDEALSGFEEKKSD